jgi:uncharacterized protein
MKRVSALVLGVLVAACGVLAQQATPTGAPASKQDVQRLFDVMASKEQLRRTMQQILVQMKTVNREQIKQRQPGISDEELDRLDRTSEGIIRDFPIDAMMNDMVPVYQRHFTKPDIDALIAFYSSSAGQKFLHEMPTVTAETMQVIYPRIMASVDAAMKGAQEKGQPQPQK